jgi:hypothetical protein
MKLSEIGNIKSSPTQKKKKGYKGSMCQYGTGYCQGPLLPDFHRLRSLKETLKGCQFQLHAKVQHAVCDWFYQQTGIH